jgi:magnesium transporter
MNEVMKLLTIITTIFIPLSFIAGIYGMNFDNMPELRLDYGYFYILGLMAAIFIAMIFYFRYKKWF